MRSRTWRVPPTELRNWRLTHPEDRGPGKVIVKLLQAQRSSIRLRHDGLGLVLHAATTPADAPPAAGSDGHRLAQRIDFDGTLHGAAFEGSAQAAETITLQHTGRAFPLRGHVAGGGGRLEFEGAAADLLRGVTLDVGVHAGGGSLAGLGAFVGGAELPQTPPLCRRRPAEEDGRRIRRFRPAGACRRLRPGGRRRLRPARRAADAEGDAAGRRAASGRPRARRRNRAAGRRRARCRSSASTPRRCSVSMPASTCG